MSENNRPAEQCTAKKYEQKLSLEYSNAGKKKENNTRDSNVVPHRSTNRARQCLTSLSRREAVLSLWFGRSQHKSPSVTSYTYLLSKNHVFLKAFIEQLSIITLSAVFATPNKVSDQLTTPRHPILPLKTGTSSKNLRSVKNLNISGCLRLCLAVFCPGSCVQRQH